MFIIRDWHGKVMDWGTFDSFEEADEVLTENVLADMRDDGINTEYWDNFDEYVYQDYHNEYEIVDLEDYDDYID